MTTNWKRCRSSCTDLLHAFGADQLAGISLQRTCRHDGQDCSCPGTSSKALSSVAESRQDFAQPSPAGQAEGACQPAFAQVGIHQAGLCPAWPGHRTDSGPPWSCLLPGKPEAISRACGGLPGQESMMEAYRACTASPSGEFGLSRKKLLVRGIFRGSRGAGRIPTIRFGHARRCFLTLRFADDGNNRNVGIPDPSPDVFRRVQFVVQFFADEGQHHAAESSGQQSHRKVQKPARTGSGCPEPWPDPRSECWPTSKPPRCPLP